MKNIVHIQNHEATVTLNDIAEFSKNDYKSVQNLLVRNSKEFEELGLSFNKEYDFKSLTLNESQSTFLITLMKNSPIVKRFKLDLVIQFYKMREFVCETNKLQLKLSQAETKKAQSNNRKVYKDGFMSLTKYIKDNDLNLKQSEAFKILNDIGAIEYRETTTIRAILIDETLGRQIDFGVIEFNSRALDSIFEISKPATLF